MRCMQAGALWVGGQLTIYILYFYSDAAALNFLFKITWFLIYILKRPVL